MDVRLCPWNKKKRVDGTFERTETLIDANVSSRPGARL